MEHVHTQTSAPPDPLAEASGPAPRGFTRCRSRNRSGSRCRLHAQDPATGLCFRHAARPGTTSDDTDLSADLFPELPANELPELRTPEQINDFLSRVVLLLAQGRISPRRAAVITFACSLLLRSVVVMDRQGSDCSLLIADLRGPDVPPRNQPSPVSVGADR
jgi:hypothetical protein